MRGRSARVVTGALGVIAAIIFPTRAAPAGPVHPPARYRFVNLQPADFFSSAAFGISDGRAVGIADTTDSHSHAILWTGASAGSAVDLNPPGMNFAYAFGAFGDVQVGNMSNVAAFPQDSRGPHAALWRGSAAGVVDLHPPGALQSFANGVFDDEAVGSTLQDVGAVPHAALWTGGTSVGYRDLHVAVFDEGTVANAVWGENQVGIGTIDNPKGVAIQRALLWHGSAEGAIDLTPAGFTASGASAAFEDLQAGWATRGREEIDGHAAVWRGSAESFVDFNPPGRVASAIRGINDGIEVGWSADTATGADQHATVWFGSADSALDLNEFVPPGWMAFNANGVDAQGRIVGYAFDPGNHGRAVMWLPESAAAIPLPPQTLPALAALAAVMVFTATRRFA